MTCCFAVDLDKLRANVMEDGERGDLRADQDLREHVHAQGKGTKDGGLMGLRRPSSRASATAPMICSQAPGSGTPGLYGADLSGSEADLLAEHVAVSGRLARHGLNDKSEGRTAQDLGFLQRPALAAAECGARKNAESIKLRRASVSRWRCCRKLELLISNRCVVAEWRWWRYRLARLRMAAMRVPNCSSIASGSFMTRKCFVKWEWERHDVLAARSEAGFDDAKETFACGAGDGEQQIVSGNLRADHHAVMRLA